MTRPEGDAPLCECHGEPKAWRSDRGYWVCAVRRREARRRWRENNRERIVAADRAYRKAKGEEYRAKARDRYYRNQARVQERMRRYYWEHREERLEYGRQYVQQGIYVCGMRLGRVGFTDSEVKEMISGSSD